MKDITEISRIVFGFLLLLFHQSLSATSTNDNQTIPCTLTQVNGKDVFHF
jgi:hypothetical protein